MSDGTGTTAYGPYDDLDALLSVTKSFTGGPQSQTLAYAHNPDGSRLSLTWPANVTNGVGGVNLGKTNYAYDGTGRHVQTKFPWLYGIWQHQYQLNGWTKRTDGPLSPGAVNPLVRTQYGYNARGFLTLLANYTDYSGGGSDLLQGASSFALTYDALGNKRTEAATVPSQGGSPLADASHALTYTYDDANASAAQNRDVLVGEVSSPYGAGTGGYNTLYSHAGAGGYGYDAAYNPTLFSYWNGGADATLSLPANSDNQISLGGFAYEGDGNPATYKGAAFGFDPEDRLTAISSPAFTATYDGNGLRATKTATLNGTTQTTYFLYDGGTPIIEETFSGTSASFSALNGWTADGWRARKQGGIVYQFVYDPQGSVQQRHTDGAYSSGLAAYDRSTFEGYGALRGAYKGSTGSGVGQHDPAGFGGQFGYYTDTETGLLCLTHRYYDPGTGKFVTRDPIGYGGGMNLYGFAGGNPVNRMDPEGTEDAPTDSMAYIGNMFNNLTPHDWLHALKHNDVTRAVGKLLEMASYLPVPENPAADVRAVEGAEALVRAGEDLYVGTYGSAKYGLRKAGNLADYTPHHVVQDAVSGTTHSKGITITIKRTIHEGLETTGALRDLPSRRHHLAADLSELRNVLRQNGYNRSIVNRQLRELSRRNKALGGFDKPSP